MGLKVLASMLIASVSGVALLAATLPVAQMPAMHVSESVSAVLVGTALIVAGSAMRRASRLSK